ncbi:type II secretion system protein [Alkalimarinus alittae]|uniref:Type II secretion system GspH family protein n=1 Tax=Alkalimarinus alittae TaxID=2961619 RepID=A0ABY6N185_9ALTE|nr:type II secretion system protein [Alkalimarinus alittae]UZE95777.1 type II secretion system GspH family protein [Alkalimarinus alittae]
MKTHKSHKGFTLVELVIVIVISGILAVGSVQFVGQATQGYSDAADRQQLATIGWIASEKISRELRNALPNSIRVNASNTCIEFIPVTGGSHYKTLPNGTTPRTITAIESGFSAVPENTRIAVYPTSVNAVYGQANPGPISTSKVSALTNSGGIDTITLAGDFEFLAASPERRFYFTESPITYCIESTRLNRYSDYGFSAAKGTAQIIVDKLQRGTFSIAPASLTRNAVVAMHFEFDGGAIHIVDQEVQVRNVP